jgi:hypothetical protein
LSATIPPEIPTKFAATSVIQMDDDSVTLLLGFGIRDVDASEIHPFEVLITVTHGEVIIGDTNGYDEIYFELRLLSFSQTAACYIYVSAGNDGPLLTVPTTLITHERTCCC